MILSKNTIEGLKKGNLQTKLIAGKFYVDVTVTVENGRLLFHFPYKKDLIEQIKLSFEKRKYHGYIEGDHRKLWSAPINYHNLFRLEVLQGKYGGRPYSNWKDHESCIEKVKAFCDKRETKLYDHQIDLVAHGYSNHWFIWAAEMGTGKTLAAIILMEMVKYDDPYFIGPRSALGAVRNEFKKWNSYIRPSFHTYEGLQKIIETDNFEIPQIIIYDESSMCKTPQAQRSKAALYMADQIRKKWGYDNSYIGLMSGSPAPKKPTDWFFQVKIACPGFLPFGDWYKFRDCVGIFKTEQTEVGSYPKLIRWRNQEGTFCDICGERRSSHNAEHDFVPMVNQVAKLRPRLEGLVNVKFKKDCLDLPPKRYEVIELDPTEEQLKLAKIAVNTSSRVVDAIIKCRTIADGFIYKESETGETKVCPVCHGTREVVDYYCDKELEDNQSFEGGEIITYLPDGTIDVEDCEPKERLVPCNCENGTVKVIKRTTIEIDTPKDDVLLERLSIHEEIGRLNVYAAFTGSINKIKRLCLKNNWSVLRIDGRGHEFTTPSESVLNLSLAKLLQIYQEGQEQHQKVVFLGQPGAAGMGLTLTASPTTYFYSNDYIPNSRIQAEDRGHRIGMDIARGGLILDNVVLPSDRKVLDNLKASFDLQKLSLTGIQECYS